MNKTIYQDAPDEKVSLEELEYEKEQLKRRAHIMEKAFEGICHATSVTWSHSPERTADLVIDELKFLQALRQASGNAKLLLDLIDAVHAWSAEHSGPCTETEHRLANAFKEFHG